MFIIDNFPEIINHLYNISRIVKRHNSNWYEIFCPYCDDATRKANPGHGHFYIAPNFPFCHCFRCGIRLGLYDFLIETNFRNVDILDKIKSVSFTHLTRNKFDLKSGKPDIYQFLVKNYNYFFTNFPKKLNEFKSYIYSRFGDIDPLSYFLSPHLDQNSNISIHFFNYFGQLATTRFTKANLRYMSYNNKYFFQNLFNIDEYNNIVISEGPIDLINSHKYLIMDDKDHFFISIGGNFIKSMITSLIQNFTLIGSYKFIIILDADIENLNINYLESVVNKLNPKVKLEFCSPLKSKDISELAYVTKY